MTPDLSITSLHAAYREGTLTPRSVVTELQKRIAAADPRIWISLTPEERLESIRARLDAESPDSLPLYGIPFAIKDNIDLAGTPTTAACPDFAYDPDKDAKVVALLVAAGALPMGKTNLDQFATGLVGVRSPYGVPENPFNADFIPGGSSSGSAVAVARDLVTFSLGTDTAGSGRTVITATHDLDIIQDIADHCFVFQNGQVVGQGKPAAILADRELLESTNLVHAHRHRHPNGSLHSHPHVHRLHEHDHGREPHGD